MKATNLIKDYKEILVTLGFTLVKEEDQLKHAQRMEGNPLLISCIKDKKITGVLENVGIAIDPADKEHRKSYFSGIKPRKFIDSLIDKTIHYNTNLLEEILGTFEIEFTKNIDLTFKWYKAAEIPTIYNIPTQSQAKDRITEAERVSKIDGKTTELLNERRSFISRNNSCMQGRPRNWFNVYQKTKDLKLCTLEDSKGNLYGRALLWYADGVHYLDRIYTADVFNGSKAMQSTYQVKLYEKVLFYLNAKKINCYSLDVICDHLTDVQRDARMSPPSPFAPVLVEGFDAVDCNAFPYADTFRGIDGNYWHKDTDDCQVGLENTDGTNSNKESCRCDECATRVPEDEIHFSDVDEQYLCDDCGIWCEDRSETINVNNAIQNQYTDEYHHCNDLDY